MKNYVTKEIKNIVLVGSPKSGKTTLAECMMYEGGVISRMGSIEDGNTVSDYHEIEKERKNSITASVMHTEWRGFKINIIDTPGLDDFCGEIIGSLRVSDTALMVLNGQYGVEVGTELIWRHLEYYKKPTIFVVNQLDHPKSDFWNTFEQAKQHFSEKVVAVQYPVNAGEGFNMIIDLLKMVMYKFPVTGGKPEKLPIPDSEKEKADTLHNRLVEAAAENDERLMEIYFEKGELDEDEMREGLKKGMLNHDVFPLFCLSAKKDMGSGRLMGFIDNVCPSADEMHSEFTTEDKQIKPDDETTTLFVFKSENEKHTGAMSFFKVCSGTLHAGQELFNTSNGASGKINQLYVIDGKNRIAVQKLHAGDIGATVKFKDTHLNHTVRAVNDGVVLKPIVFPNPRIRMAIEVVKQQDEEKMAQQLNKLHESDPTLIVEFSQELKQTLLHAQGELHLQVIKWILEHIHSIEIKYVNPRISYRETIQQPAKATYRHKKQSGGAGQFGEVFIHVEPYYEGMSDPAGFNIRGKEVQDLPWGGKLIFYNCIVGGVIEARFLPAILKGIMEKMEEGPLTGSPARDVCVAVYDGKMHAVDSNEISFKIAGMMAFKEAFVAANPKIMEPINKLEVYVPAEYTGDVMTDLQTRRAIVENIGSEGNYQKIVARVPLSELNRYATSLSSITQGRASFSTEFLEYSPTPPDVQAKLIQAHSANHKEENH